MSSTWVGARPSIAAVAPYAWGDVSGNVGEDRRSVSRSGWGDTRLKLSAILIGGPALSTQAFAARKPGPIVGASVVAVLPTGEYNPTRLINIGANRWALKPEIGVSYPMGRWQADAYAGVWLFGDNDNFFGGRRKTQDPMGSFQAHLSYTVRPRLWAAVDATYYTGGATRLDGVGGSDRQNNVRVGATVSLPVARRPIDPDQLQPRSGHPHRRQVLHRRHSMAVGLGSLRAYAGAAPMRSASRRNMMQSVCRSVGKWLAVLASCWVKALSSKPRSS
jgi:hypothetical protein